MRLLEDDLASMPVCSNTFARCRRLNGRRWARIAEAQRSVGQSHLHKGLGLRKLQDDYFEIRAGLKLRLVFDNTPSELVFENVGRP